MIAMEFLHQVVQLEEFKTILSSSIMFNGEPTADDHGNVLYEIRKDPVVGRYMVASRYIQPGEVIFTDSQAFKNVS